jgi:hypothetical protein
MPRQARSWGDQTREQACFLTCLACLVCRTDEIFTQGQGIEYLGSTSGALRAWPRNIRIELVASTSARRDVMRCEAACANAR